MDVAVYVPIAASVLAALAGRPLADRLPPRLATWLLTGAALVLAATTVGALALLALAAAVRVPAFAAIGGLSVPVLGHGDPVPLPVGLAGAAALAYALAAGARAAARRTAALLSTHKEAGKLPGRGQVVVIGDDSPDAYTLPGWPGRIIVTSAMLAALSDQEAAVLVAHERAHVAGRHHLFTAVARVASAADPLLAPLAAAIGYCVERWADEQAAAAAGSRLLAAHAVASAALATSTADTSLPPGDARTTRLPASSAQPAGRAAGVPARHGPAGDPCATMAMAGPPTAPAPPARTAARSTVAAVRPGRAGPVPRRVAALLLPPARMRPVLLAATVALVVLAGLAVTDSATDLHGLIEIAQKVFR